MKIAELMIGDWVKYYDCNLEKECYAQVTSIQADGTEPFVQTSDSDVYYLAEVYKPIPLTAEILEKNGFEGSPTKDMYLHIELWEQCQLKVELCQSEGLFVFVYTDKAPIDMYVNHILLHIRYVHELQRVLRCCGLWDLADKFVV